MDFAYDDTTEQLRERLLAFMDECVYPSEQRFRDEVHGAENPWATPPVIEELKVEARSRGLWNLFLPRMHEYGAGLTNLQYAPLAEITGRNVWMAPEALNCSAPDTGNMELLSLFGTRGAQAPLARAVARRQRALGVLDDRAGRRLIGRDQHLHADRTRRRRIRDQRPQVVVIRRDVATLRPVDRDGCDRPGRRAASPAEHDPRAEEYARC